MVETSDERLAEYPETLYMSIVIADYVEDADVFDISVQYQAALPTEGADEPACGFNQIKLLAANLAESGDRATITAYAEETMSSPYVSDFAIKDVVEEEPGTGLYWLTWLEDKGYDEFVTALEETARKNDTYLVGSHDDLSKAAVRAVAEPYFRERREARLARQESPWRHPRSF